MREDASRINQGCDSVVEFFVYKHCKENWRGDAAKIGEH